MSNEKIAKALADLLSAASFSAATGKPFAADSPGILAVREALAELDGLVLVPRDELLRVARMAEALKRDCGMDPESPQAVRNGQYMNISYALRAMVKP